MLDKTQPGFHAVHNLAKARHIEQVKRLFSDPIFDEFDVEAFENLVRRYRDRRCERMVTRASLQETTRLPNVDG
jgi:hypothetical protein